MAKDAGLKIYFRTTPKLRGCFSRLTGALRATEAISGKKGYTSNDAILNALLLWAVERDPEALAEELGPFIAHFESVWDEVLAHGAARPDAVPSAAAPSPPVAAAEKDEWVTGGIRHRTDGDNARIARRNRQLRGESRAGSKGEAGESAPTLEKREREGEAKAKSKGKRRGESTS